MTDQHDLWVERYRPKTLEQYVFQSDENEKYFRQIVETGNLPNLLISGTQGTGKSTIIQVLINEIAIDSHDVMWVNASSESGIDQVRERINNFCHSFPLGRIKVVVMEEADGLSVHAQKALRAVIEKYTDTVRFLFTANYARKVIPALQSRCQQIEIEAFDFDRVVDYALDILEKEDVLIQSDDDFLDHVEKFTPDLRKIIQSMQQSVRDGELHAPDTVSKSSDIVDQWREIWENGDIKASYGDLSKLALSADEGNIERLYRIMYDNVSRLGEDEAMVAIPIIAKHLYRSHVVADQAINLDSCLIQMLFDVTD